MSDALPNAPFNRELMAQELAEFFATVEPPKSREAEAELLQLFDETVLGLSVVPKEIPSDDIFLDESPAPDDTPAKLEDSSDLQKLFDEIVLNASARDGDTPARTEDAFDFQKLLDEIASARDSEIAEPVFSASGSDEETPLSTIAESELPQRFTAPPSSLATLQTSWKKIAQLERENRSHEVSKYLKEAKLNLQSMIDTQVRERIETQAARFSARIENLPISMRPNAYTSALNNLRTWLHHYRKEAHYAWPEYITEQVEILEEKQIHAAFDDFRAKFHENLGIFRYTDSLKKAANALFVMRNNILYDDEVWGERFERFNLLTVDFVPVLSQKITEFRRQIVKEVLHLDKDFEKLQETLGGLESLPQKLDYLERYIKQVEGKARVHLGLSTQNEEGEEYSSYLLRLQDEWDYWVQEYNRPQWEAWQQRKALILALPFEEKIAKLRTEIADEYTQLNNTQDKNEEKETLRRIFAEVHDLLRRLPVEHSQQQRELSQDKLDKLKDIMRLFNHSNVHQAKALPIQRLNLPTGFTMRLVYHRSNEPAILRYQVPASLKTWQALAESSFAPQGVMDFLEKAAQSRASMLLVTKTSLDLGRSLAQLLAESALAGERLAIIADTEPGHFYDGDVLHLFRDKSQSIAELTALLKDYQVDRVWLESFPFDEAEDFLEMARSFSVFTAVRGKSLEAARQLLALYFPKADYLFDYWLEIDSKDEDNLRLEQMASPSRLIWKRGNDSPELEILSKLDERYKQFSLPPVYDPLDAVDSAYSICFHNDGRATIEYAGKAASFETNFDQSGQVRADALAHWEKRKQNSSNALQYITEFIRMSYHCGAVLAYDEPILLENLVREAKFGQASVDDILLGHSILILGAAGLYRSMLVHAIQKQLEQAAYQVYNLDEAAIEDIPLARRKNLVLYASYQAKNSADFAYLKSLEIPMIVAVDLRYGLRNESLSSLPDAEFFASFSRSILIERLANRRYFYSLSSA